MFSYFYRYRGGKEKSHPPTLFKAQVVHNRVIPFKQARAVTCRYVNETFNQFHESVTDMKQQFNTMNSYFATVNDEMFLETPVIEDSVIT